MATALDTYLPFDAGAGANVTEDQWRKMARLWAGSGPLRGEDNECAVYDDNSGMQVKVKTGKCFIRGHYGENTSEKILAITANASGLTRIDRVVLRADFVANQIVLDVIAGTPGGAAPAVTQSTSMWEISLATVSVPTGDTSISGQTTDTRMLISPPSALAGDQLVNGYRGMVVLAPPANDVAVEGIIVKAPGPSWGYGSNYAEGNAIVVLGDADNTVMAGSPIFKTITATTNATPVKVTATAHGFSTGDVVRISGTGITALDGGAAATYSKWWKITKVDADNFTLDTSTAPGSTSATGSVFSDRSAVLGRLIDSSLGIGNIHLAAGLRSRSGQVSNGAVALDIDPTTDCYDLILRNALTTEWAPTPTLDFMQVQDLRGASGGRTVFKIEADGTVTMRPQEGKAAASAMLRTRNTGDTANLFEVRNSGGYFAQAESAIGLLAPVSGELLSLATLTDAGGAIAIYNHSASHSGDLLTLFNYLGQTLTRFNKDGRLIYKHSTAPALGDLNDGEFTFWYDSTLPGAKVTRRTSGALTTSTV